MKAKSIILDTDSYKVSMWKQYPPGTQYVYSYIESRGGQYDKTLLLGIQAYIREVLSKPITQKEIDFAEKFWTAHGEPFNREGWQYILDKHNGYLPVEIRSVDEGTMVPVLNVLATIVNTDPMVPWITTWIETSFLRAIWYPTTVATQSWSIKQVIKEALKMSGDVTGLPFKLHDFGSRGVSSYESAYVGAMSHLVNFMGTDTAIGIIAANEYYDADIYNTAFSIPAAEHSTITSWGRDKEALAYENMVKQFSKPGAIYAVVSDSYDIYNAVDMWGTELKDIVVKNGGTLVIRPDSGDPAVVVPKLLKKLDQYFGSTVNEKGFKVLNNVRIIWGDGINELSIRTILMVAVTMNKFSADNLAFGMGGALLQIVNRDTQKFAMKCSAAMINGEWVDVFKDPITDSGKKSKKGRFMVIRENGQIKTVPYDESKADSDIMKVRYSSGKISNEVTFSEVRANSEM